MKGALIEQRLKSLEGEVAELKRRMEQMSVLKRNWIQEIAGSMKDYPEFEEVARLGAEIRRHDQPMDE